MVKADTFAALDVQTLSAAEREHVTAVFYHHPQQFRILNVTSGDLRRAELSYVVDTIDDWRRLETTWANTDLQEGVWR
jgi:spore coat polysaccharide biosynthesis protein SpsF (cytidylyltransferase family)